MSLVMETRLERPEMNVLGCVARMCRERCGTLESVLIISRGGLKHFSNTKGTKTSARIYIPPGSRSLSVDDTTEPDSFCLFWPYRYSEAQ